MVPQDGVDHRQSCVIDVVDAIAAARPVAAEGGVGDGQCSFVVNAASLAAGGVSADHRVDDLQRAAGHVFDTAAVLSCGVAAYGGVREGQGAEVENAAARGAIIPRDRAAGDNQRAVVVDAANVAASADRDPGESGARVGECVDARHDPADERRRHAGSAYVNRIGPASQVDGQGVGVPVCVGNGDRALCQPRDHSIPGGGGVVQDHGAPPESTESSMVMSSSPGGSERVRAARIPCVLWALPTSMVFPRPP